MICSNYIQADEFKDAQLLHAYMGCPAYITIDEPLFGLSSRLASHIPDIPGTIAENMKSVYQSRELLKLIPTDLSQWPPAA